MTHTLDDPSRAGSLRAAYHSCSPNTVGQTIQCAIENGVETEVYLRAAIRQFEASGDDAGDFIEAAPEDDEDAVDFVEAALGRFNALPIAERAEAFGE